MLLHALIPASRANGPGIRAVLFFQGCSIGCPKCWNPSTHQFLGTEVTVDAVAQQVLRAHQEHTLQGVTFSGGEPMQQGDNLLRLIQRLRQQAPELSFGMFSGYTERHSYSDVEMSRAELVDRRWLTRFLIFPLTCGKFTCVSSGGGVRTPVACRFRSLCGRRLPIRARRTGSQEDSCRCSRRHGDCRTCHQRSDLALGRVSRASWHTEHRKPDDHSSCEGRGCRSEERRVGKEC